MHHVEVFGRLAGVCFVAIICNYPIVVIVVVVGVVGALFVVLGTFVSRTDSHKCSSIRRS